MSSLILSSIGESVVKIVIKLLSIIILMVVFAAVSLKWTLNDNNYQAREFLTQFVPLLNEYKRVHRCYPDEFPTEWLSQRNISELVEIDYFYYSFNDDGGCEFLLRFRDPNSTWADDGVFGIQSNYGDEWLEL